MDRLAVSLGNKHFDEMTGVDTIGGVGPGKVSALRESRAQIRDLSDLWAACRNSNAIVGLRN